MITQNFRMGIRECQALICDWTWRPDTGHTGRGVVGQGVGGHHHPRAHQAPDGAHVGPQFSGVTTTTTFTVKIPDSGEVSSPGHGAEEGILVGGQNLFSGLDMDSGNHQHFASISLSPCIGHTAVR